MLHWWPLMKHSNLSRLFWESTTIEQVNHYNLALQDRGWVPGRYTRLEALEERGRASKTTSSQPDQPAADEQVPDTTPELRICGCGNGFSHFHGTLHL